MSATIISEGGMDLTLLSETLHRILRVEQRIEGKLDGVLATMSSSDARTSFQWADAQAMVAMEAETEHCYEGNPGAKSEGTLWAKCDDLPYSKPRRNSSKPSGPEEAERRSSSKIICSGTSMPRMNTPILQRAGQMRRAFKMLIDAKDIEGEQVDDLFYAKCHKSIGQTLQERTHCIPINPNSTFSICWALLTIVVLATQLTYVPFELAWNVEAIKVSLVFFVFWCLDICLGFFSGTYDADGEINPIRVSAKEYAKNSFFLDILLVLMDFISFFDWGGSNLVKLLRFSKIARMVRICTFLRMSKISWSLDRIMDTAPLVTRSRMILRVAFLCICILWILHITACCWFLIGNIGLSDTGERWLDLPTLMADGMPLDLRTKEMSMQYVVCFHWSVATFTLGNMEVGNANTFERAFGILVNIIGFIFGSVVISLLSTILVEHQAADADDRVKLRTVRRFLGENKVRSSLCLRIQRVCIERLKMEKKLTFRETTALENLPSSLYKELRYEIIGRFLSRHDLFICWSAVNVRVAEDYSVDGVELIFFKPGDDLFEANTDSDQAYFFSSGALEYSKSDMVIPSNITLVPPGTWLSEAALWSHWRHVGTCKARSRCKCAVARYERLAHHLQSYPLILSITLSYCELFCRGIALAAPPISEFPDDLCVPFTKFAEMLMQFPKELRVLISKRAFDMSKLGKTCAEKLEKEVNEGKCALYININGDLERTVAVTVLVMNNDEGNVLYQVGKSVPVSFLDENGEEGRHWEFEPEFKLPGLKQDQGEHFEETLKRLVDTKLAILNEKFEHISTQFIEEKFHSKEFGLETRYFRTKIICSMREAFPAKLVNSCNNNCPHRQHTNLGPSEVIGSPTWMRRPSELKQQSAALVSPIHFLSLSSIPLYVIFEGIRPCIYAWLSHDIADTLNESSQHHRDEVLNRILDNIDDNIIEQGLQEWSSLLNRLNRFPM